MEFVTHHALKELANKVVSVRELAQLELGIIMEDAIETVLLNTLQLMLALIIVLRELLL